MLVLEYPFNLVIYLAAVVVIIGIIFALRDSIQKSLCIIFPQFCQQGEQCQTIQASETFITEETLNKYCNLCWSKTGNLNSKSGCFCYVVKGIFNYQEARLPEYCRLKCQNNVTSIFVNYDPLLKQVSIEC